MPKGPQGQKRPADAIGCAVMVGRIATGELTEILKKPSGNVRSGHAGATARANKLTGKDARPLLRKLRPGAGECDGS
jgi:hypothetical protein